MTDESPYQLGYQCSMDAKPPFICPYAEGTKECKDWWDGFGDATDDYIQYQST